ncbi:hypothetical protein BDR26DRAFT_860412 [Obelidium mucronatum]|nr:hypothetical protein BDR26DRAFT_860412 [Obelidium mucronatum]
MHLDIATTSPAKWQPPNAARSTDKRARLFGVPSAPVFYPTLQEWSESPLKYIESIRAKGEEWGLAKIVPPKGWNPGFHIDQETFRFETRIQKLNSIDGASRSTVNYLDQLELFHEQSGTHFVRVPVLDQKKPLDLWILKKEVEKRGGFDSVSNSNKWGEIAVALGAEKGSSSAPHTVRVSYMKWVHPYEEFVRTNLKLTLGNNPDSVAPKVMGMGRMMTSAGRMMKRIAEHNEDGAGEAPVVPVSSNCQICNLGKANGKLLKCDQCKMRFHTHCLQPVVNHLPEFNWYCALCLKTHGDDFGFQQEGTLQSLGEFQKVADEFKESYFREKRQREGTMRDDGKVYVTEEEMEREFWKLVEEDRFKEDGVEVQYGADLHSSEHGSGFPLPGRDPSNPYSKSGWNVNNMPILSESLFCNIRNDISGMMVPWLYVGMAFSAFCWHTEDHYTYSVNYNHWGDTKTWYGIPASDAVKFEVLMKKKVPELFETNPDLLFHLTTILSPRHLQQNMVRCCSIDQRAGEFIVTFPRSYHAGFNQGMNFAEAVNFALPSWLPYGLSCVDRYVKFHKQPVFSHEELVIATALKDSSIKTCLWLKPEVDILCDREISARSLIRTKYAAHLTEITETDTLTAQSRDIFCEVCRAYCFCTSVSLACSVPKISEVTGETSSPALTTAVAAAKVVCWRHVEQLQNHCECETKALIMRIRYTDEELRGFQARVGQVASIPTAWLKKYTDLMVNYHRPPLKELQQLALSGDTMGYVLEEWVSLKGFLVEVEKWVEDVRVAIGRPNLKILRGTPGHTKPSSVSEVKETTHVQPYIPRERTMDVLLALLKRVEELPVECPEIEILQTMVKDAADFRDRMNEMLSQDVMELEMVNEALEELAKENSRVQVIIPGAELLQEAQRDLEWIHNAASVLSNPLAWYEEVDAVIFNGRGGSKEQPDRDSQFPGCNALKKKKMQMMVELRKKRSSSDKWIVDSIALFKQKTLQPYEINELMLFRGKIPVVKETYDRLVIQYDSVVQAIMAVRKLVQSTPNLKAPFVDVTTWDVKPLVSTVLSKAEQIIQSVGLPIKIDELKILEREVKKVEEWVKKCKRLMCKGPSSRILKHAMKPLKIPSNHKDVYCFCRKGADGLMVECDVCHIWYHTACLGVGKRNLKSQSEFVCNLCDVGTPFQRVPGKRTITLDQLASISEEADKLPLLPTELNSLNALVANLKSWKSRVFNEYSGKSVTIKDLNRMRDEVRCLEGFPIEIDNATSDSLYAKCQVIQLSPRARGIVTAVPTQVYCLCRGAGADNMIGCDFCEEWYHFQCVGLTAESAAAIDSYKCSVCRGKEKPMKKIKLNIREPQSVVEVEGTRKSKRPVLVSPSKDRATAVAKRIKTGSPVALKLELRNS